VLGILIDQYENEHFPVGMIQLIKFRMEQMGYNQNDLANIVGLKNASEILNRKRKLSLEMIRQLHEQLNIPTDVLIQAY
jgi:HTH-type transcriptional regulator/antitoxin HigA